MRTMNRFLMSGALTMVLLLTGCGGRQEPQQAPEQGGGQKQQGGQQEGKQQENPVAQGADKMQAKLDDLRLALEDGTPTEVQQEARALDDAWEAFEAKVQAKNPEMYGQVERPLHAVLAAVQIAPLDNVLIRGELDRLEHTLTELKETNGSQPKPEKVDMKTGLAAMRQELTEFREVIATGDTARIQEKAGEIDHSWAQFKEEVREKDREAYDNIEKPLHAIMSGVEQSPMNPTKLREHVEQLDSQLAQLKEQA